MTFNCENILKCCEINALRFNLKKFKCISWCELENKITDGRQALYQNSENTPKPLSSTRSPLLSALFISLKIILVNFSKSFFKKLG